MQFIRDLLAGKKAAAKPAGSFEFFQPKTGFVKKPFAPA
jgi:hypothetical protein